MRESLHFDFDGVQRLSGVDSSHSTCKIKFELATSLIEYFNFLPILITKTVTKLSQVIRASPFIYFSFQSACKQTRLRRKIVKAARNFRRIGSNEQADNNTDLMNPPQNRHPIPADCAWGRQCHVFLRRAFCLLNLFEFTKILTAHFTRLESTEIMFPKLTSLISSAF